MLVGPAWASDKTADPAGQRTAIESRLIPDAILGEWRCWRLQLDKAGPEADLGALPGGQALPAAATLYALDRLDFDVSLRDLAEQGYWPYAFPAGTDLEQRIQRSDTALLGCTALGNSWWLDNLGTAEWHAAAKAQILLHYAAALNSFLGPAFAADYAPAAAPGAATGRTSGPTTAGTGAEIPQLPLEAFFVNPYTGKPMEERDSPGDYQSVALAKVLPAGRPVNAALIVRVLSGTLLPAERPFVTYTDSNFDASYRAPLQSAEH
jgi:hypothetical protein